jgi:hypothetical protein
MLVALERKRQTNKLVERLLCNSFSRSICSAGFSVAEVRISASTGELSDRLIEAFRDLRVQRIGHSETLRVYLSFEEF